MHTLLATCQLVEAFMRVHTCDCRMGLASALMQAAEEVSREAKLHSLYLHARVKDLEAQSFYTKMRYSPAGRDSRFAAVWHHAVQRVMFYKDL